MRISDWSSDVCSSDLAGIRLEWWLYILSILSIGVVWWLVQNQAVVGTLLGISGAILVIYVLATAVTKLPPHDRDRIFAAMFLILGSILFWALFEQAGSSINLYTEDRKSTRLNSSH